KKSKTPLLIGGGVLALVVVGGIIAAVAGGGKKEPPPSGSQQVAQADPKEKDEVARPKDEAPRAKDLTVKKDPPAKDSTGPVTKFPPADPPKEQPKFRPPDPQLFHNAP